MNLSTLPEWRINTSPDNEIFDQPTPRATKHVAWNIERPPIKIQREELSKFLKQNIPPDTPDEIVEKEYDRYLGKILSKKITANSDIISQELSDYIEKTTSKNDQVAFAFFSFYEEKSKEIYKIIKDDDPTLLITIDNQDPSSAVIDIFSPESTYNKDIICLKTQQEIQCVSDNPYVESYIKQSKKDWTRSPFYSSKYNEYYKKLEHKKTDQYTEKADVLPYLNSGPDADKLFLITADAINNYFMSSQYYPGLQIDTQENIQENLGKIDCDCEKVEDHPLICSGFNVLQIPNDKVKKILYNLSFINQAQKSEIMKIYFNLPQVYKDLYDQLTLNVVGEDGNLMYNLGEGPGYYYMDEKNQSGVYMNSLIVMVTKSNGDLIYVPLYKIIMIFPFEISDYYYTFLYVDNDPPANVGKKKSFFSSQSSITAEYYTFLGEKIKWYLDKPSTDFINGKYVGADYLNYINKKANEFNKIHKPYTAPPYRSPTFVPPEKTPITSSRLLGGKTRRKYNNKTKKHKTKKHKTKKHKTKKYKALKKSKHRSNTHRSNTHRSNTHRSKK